MFIIPRNLLYVADHFEAPLYATLRISLRRFPGIGNSSELRSPMADILDVALETAVDKDAT